MALAADAQKKTFDLPAGYAEQTLKKFSEQSGMEVLMPTAAVKDIRTLSVRGEMTPREALGRMLSGTALVASPNEKTGIVTVRRESSIAAAEKNGAGAAQTMASDRRSPQNPAPIRTQSNPQSGTITGRVLDPATREYVRNAEVRVEGTGLLAISEDGGFYRLSGVAPGQVTLVVAYTGYQPITATVALEPGATVARDFELTSSLASTSTGNATLTLDAFVVSSERAGNAKAIMQQRSSMDITNSVSSDLFGDVAEGNVGEFLKHIPGVDIRFDQGEVASVRLRGLDPEYAAVTMDGVSLASTDATTPGLRGRAFRFDQTSISSMDSIEVSKTISADADANAPAGTINLKSKRAFNFPGRRVTAQANVTAFSARFNFDNSYGPWDRKSLKILPGGIFEYGDVFFDKRLGVILNISESNAYSAFARATVGYNYTPVGADSRPAVPTTLTFLHVPRTTRRSTVTFTADYKATSRLVLSLGLVYNYSQQNKPQRTLTFNTGARNTVLGADPVTSFTTSAPNASVISNIISSVRLGQTLSAVPRFEYKIGNFILEGRFAGSESMNWFDPRGRNRSLFNMGNPTLTGLTFSAQRSSSRSVDWKIVQTGGPDMDSGANFSSSTITLDDGRFAGTGVYSGEILGTLRTNKLIPVVWKAGLKRKFETSDFHDHRDSL
ncbi:MAG: carboxypeptidase regulatory-like domain-containing protein, partial [Opitutaceae bacterium]